MRAPAAVVLGLLTLAAAGCSSGTGGVVPGNADKTAGKQLFTQKCGACHTLREAGTKGVIGPNLDSSKPGFQQVRAKVVSGGGGMPSFGSQLSATQIRDVAAFVALNAGR